MSALPGTSIARKNRVPNKITCGTVLPNGRTVGSYVNQLSNTINNASQMTSTPYDPSASHVPGYSPLSVPGQVYSQTNFKIMFRGQGNAAFLGDAENFAYAVVSANIGVPLWATEAVAGGTLYGGAIKMLMGRSGWTPAQQHRFQRGTVQDAKPSSLRRLLLADPFAIVQEGDGAESF